MSGNQRSAWGQRAAVLAAVLLVAALAAIDFMFYRPAEIRLKAAEADVSSLQAQIAATGRTRLGEDELLKAVDTGPEGAELKARYAEGGLVYLNRLIDRSGLARTDFRTEPATKDGPFTVERFFVSLSGSWSEIFQFMKTLEAGTRLSRVEEFRLEQVEGTGTMNVRFRAAVYGLPPEASTQ